MKEKEIFNWKVLASGRCLLKKQDEDTRVVLRYYFIGLWGCVRQSYSHMCVLSHVGSGCYKVSVLVSINCELIREKDGEACLNFFITSQHYHSMHTLKISFDPLLISSPVSLMAEELIENKRRHVTFSSRAQKFSISDRLYRHSPSLLLSERISRR